MAHPTAPLTRARLLVALARSPVLLCLDLASSDGSAAVLRRDPDGRLRPAGLPVVITDIRARSPRERREFTQRVERLATIEGPVTPVIWAHALRPGSREEAFASRHWPDAPPLDLQALVRASIEAEPSSALAVDARASGGLADRRLLVRRSVTGGRTIPGAVVMAGLLAAALEILYPAAESPARTEPAAKTERRPTNVSRPPGPSARTEMVDKPERRPTVGSMDTHRDLLLATATRAISGAIADINVRRDGSLVLLNAGKEMLWTGFSPEAELLKGLVVRVDEADRAVELIAGCLGKFYNHTESASNDAAFFAAVAQPGARLIFTEKADGSCLRALWNPVRGEVEFATRGMLRAQSGAGGYLDYCGLAASLAETRYPDLLEPGLVRRYTVVCELIHPANRIVTHYGDTEALRVITVIDLASGAELSRAETVAFCSTHRLEPVAEIAPPSDDFDEAIAEMRRRWADSDVEGMVVAVEIPGAPVPFRLKVKSLRYLALARLKNACTLRRTRELAEANGLATWPEFRAYLAGEFPDLPEEIQMGYREKHAIWLAWDAEVRSAVESTVATYLAHPARTADQKTFALAIAARPDRAAHFLRRNAKDEAAGRVALDRLVRRGHEDRLVDTTGTLDTLALAG